MQSSEVEVQIFGGKRLNAQSITVEGTSPVKIACFNHTRNVRNVSGFGTFAVGLKMIAHHHRLQVVGSSVQLLQQISNYLKFMMFELQPRGLLKKDVDIVERFQTNFVGVEVDVSCSPRKIHFRMLQVDPLFEVVAGVAIELVAPQTGNG